MPAIDPTSHLSRPAERESLVSVILPTYNRASLVSAAVSSVLRQSWSDVEVVVIDDGSRDDTREIVSALAEADERVRYLHQPNGGVSSARNRGLANCRGGMIAFLDSDDAWHPWKLKAQVGVLQALPEVGMVWSDMHAIDLEGRLLHSKYLRRMYKGYARVGQGELFRQTALLRDIVPDSEAPDHASRLSWGRIYSPMLSGNLVHTPTVPMRRATAAAVGPFDESMKAGGEDYKFHLATTRLGDVAFLDAATIDYRIGGEDQITNVKNQVNFATSFLKTLDEQVQNHRDQMQVTDGELEAIRADAHDWLASALIEGGQRRRAATHALRAIRQRPATSSAWKTLAKTMLPRTAIDLVRAARGLRTRTAAASM